jgi:CRP-like cAMP-binding protein
VLEYDLALIDDLEEKLKSELVRYGKVVNFKKNEILFNSNELQKYFYIVIEGKIKSYQINFKNSKEQTIFIYRKGDMFDTIVLLDNNPHELLYQALENSKAIELPIELVREWLVTNRAFNSKFFPYLAAQMRQVEELAVDVTLFSTAQRLIKLLLQSLDVNNRFRFNLIQNLSNSEIAKLIGSARQVVERHLKAFKKEGFVDKDKNKSLSIKKANLLLEQIDNFS